MDYKDKILKRVEEGLSLNEKQQAFYDNYLASKDIIVIPGLYKHKTESIEFEVLSIQEDVAQVKTVKSGFVRERTLHWCRKYLEKS
jgi:hypothetical protein